MKNLRYASRMHWSKVVRASSYSSRPPFFSMAALITGRQRSTPIPVASRVSVKATPWRLTKPR